MSTKQVKQRSTIWLYGRHACIAAINNEQRRVKRVLVTDNAYHEIKEFDLHDVEKVRAEVIERNIPQGAVHQGIALEVMPLRSGNIADIYDAGLVVLLDQVTDPHNIGAILRSCAAFGAAAIIMPENNAPEESGVMAKSASGALEIVPIIRVTNLAKTMKELKKRDFWFVGMDGGADMSIKEVPQYEKRIIVMGAEGVGLRRLTAENCDILARLPISRAVESLNVSNAAAIALYELS